MCQDERTKLTSHELKDPGALYGRDFSLCHVQASSWPHSLYQTAITSIHSWGLESMSHMGLHGDCNCLPSGCWQLITVPLKLGNHWALASNLSYGQGSVEMTQYYFMEWCFDTKIKNKKCCENMKHIIGFFQLVFFLVLTYTMWL